MNITRKQFKELMNIFLDKNLIWDYTDFKETSDETDNSIEVDNGDGVNCIFYFNKDNKLIDPSDVDKINALQSHINDIEKEVDTLAEVRDQLKNQEEINQLIKDKMKLKYDLIDKRDQLSAEVGY